LGNIRLTSAGLGFFLEKLQILPVNILVSQNAEDELSDEFREPGALERVKRPLRDFSLAHEIRIPQMGQVSRYLCLGGAQNGLEVANTKLPLKEQIDDPQTRLVGEGLKGFKRIIHRAPPGRFGKKTA
jgi:hypothetical protein